jgi:hypothetical protein
LARSASHNQKLLVLVPPDSSLLHKLLKIINTDTKNIPKAVGGQQSFANISADGFFLTEELLRQDADIVVGFVLDHPGVFKIPGGGN